MTPKILFLPDKSLEPQLPPSQCPTPGEDEGDCMVLFVFLLRDRAKHTCFSAVRAQLPRGGVPAQGGRRLQSGGQAAGVCGVLWDPLRDDIRE